MKIIHNLTLPLLSTHADAIRTAIKTTGASQDATGYVYRESIDCRRNKLSKVYSVVLSTDIDHPKLSELKTYSFNPPENINRNKIPYIIGMGPAGLFCALILTEYGIKPVIADRGDPVGLRIEKVTDFWKGGQLDENSNVQFGEGGAGTFSDGKLTTRINDPRCRKVLEELVKYGAPEDILYRAKPHIGTDILRKTVANIRDEIIKRGGKFLYGTKLDDISINNGKLTEIKLGNERFTPEYLVLAIGNGAFDTFRMLMNKNLTIEKKPFSVGFRQEHLQEDLNFARYGKTYLEAEKLSVSGFSFPAADYSFNKHLSKDTCVYTFCMCPGGLVVNASSIKGRLTTNGMSLYSRDSLNANSALLVSITPKNISQAMELQELLEKNAFNVAGGAAPFCRGSDLQTDGNSLKAGKITPSFMPGTENSKFSKVFPSEILNSLRTGARAFEKEIFRSISIESPVYTAPETRTSSPLRITRDSKNFYADGAENLYPCGEGAGYAGGIMSSAVDGIKIAEAIICKSSE